MLAEYCKFISVSLSNLPSSYTDRTGPMTRRSTKCAHHEREIKRMKYKHTKWSGAQPSVPMWKEYLQVEVKSSLMFPNARERETFGQIAHSCQTRSLFFAYCRGPHIPSQQPIIELVSDGRFQSTKNLRMNLKKHGK